VGMTLIYTTGPTVGEIGRIIEENGGLEDESRD